MKTHQDAPIFVGIAGGTGSGKSTIAANVARGLPQKELALLDHDSYYRHHPDLSFGERELLNYDHPDALDNDLLIEHLDDLKVRKPIEVPEYDFMNHLRSEKTRRVDPAPIVILEGILVLQDERIRQRLDVKVFVDTDADIRVFRRIRRDMENRGRTFSQIREQYYKTVRPMHLQFVEPSKRWADLIIPEGGNNHVALDLVLARLSMFLQSQPTTS